MSQEAKLPDFEKILPEPYGVDDNCLCIVYKRGEEEDYQKLCNFVLYITDEFEIDDGCDVVRKIRIKGIHQNGEVLNPVDIMASDLTSTTLSWIVEKWGAKCNIETKNVKDKIRHAIQCTARFAQTICIHKQFGWKKLNTGWEFLNKGNEVEVEAVGKLRNYHFKSCHSDHSLKAVYGLLHGYFVSPSIIYSLVAFAFLSPLNSFLKKVGYEPKFVMCLIGKTGTKKSTLAALILSFFGDFSNTDLPFSFRDTANSIISATFLLKDMLTVIDDFHPSTSCDNRRMNNAAQMIMRGYGDRVGRGRLNSDSTPMMTKYPTGNAIITGEQAPEVTQSGLARCLILELEQDGVDLDELTEFQKKAKDGLLCSAMKLYIAYIKETFLDADEQVFLDRLSSMFSEYRNKFASKLQKEEIEYHDRLPEMGSWLMIGFEFLQMFFKANYIISEKESANEIEFAFGRYYLLLKKQAKTVKEDKPSEIFIKKLSALLESGRAYTIDRFSTVDNRGNGFIGYHDAEYYYLIGETTFSMVKTFSTEQGEHFPIGMKRLLKHLSDESYIESTGNGTNTHVVRVQNKQIRAIKILREKVEGIVD